MNPMRFAFLLCLLPLITFGDQTLINFHALSPSDVARSWPRGGGQAAVELSEHGAIFPLLFQREDKRIFFDAVGAWNLTQEDCIRLELDVARPQDILEATLHVKSGAGWYSHSFTFNGPGRQVLNLPLADFSPEGTPGGWKTVSAIRFAFWPRAVGRATVRPLALRALRAPVVLVDGSSASPADERYLCRVTLKRMQELLNKTGIPYAKYSAASLATLGQRSALILPYLPSPDTTVLSSLNARMHAGSKLIVFQSKSEALARTMGISLGGELTSESVGRFDHMQFEQATTAPAFPSRIYQHAWSLQSISPSASSSRVLATWAAQDGTSLKMPAVIQSPSGYWISHVWRSADSIGKAQALTIMLGTLDPGLWTWAAQTLYQRVHPRSFQVKHGSFPANHKASARMREVADQFYQRGVDALKRGDGRTAWGQFARVEPLLFRALASSRSRWNAPMRGIWDQQGTGFGVGTWPETCASLRRAGFNAVFCYVGSAGRANYRSTQIPGSITLKRHGDQVAQFTRAARANGLQRHLWKICWKLNSADPAFTARMKREGRLMQDGAGNTLPWLSPSDPRNVKHEVDGILELLRNYPAEGIHLDYMRYPGLEADFSPFARRAFESRHGPVANWPRDLQSGSRVKEFNRFRQEELHRAMERISRAVKLEFPRVVLSVAVWGAYPDCAVSKAQDWPVWLQRNYADVLIPMNYTENPYQYEGWLREQVALPGCRNKLIPGLGLISSSAELDPSMLLQQMEISKRHPVQGSVLYRLDSSLPERLFPLLEAGIWKN